MQRTLAIVFLVAVASTANAQTTHHLEACTKWDVENNQSGFTNKCGQPVMVQFMDLDSQDLIVREVAPGERFLANLSGKWMSTRCPVGYASSVPFNYENRQAIVASKYSCVKK